MQRILHVDMDAFFAAIERLRHPELEGQPLIVGGRGDPFARGVVSTASYEARPFGIHSGMALRTAYHRCPQAVFLPVDFDLYVEVSARIKKLLRRFSRRIEDAGLDEAYLDISESPGRPRTIARAIKALILRETGLTCSVGVGPNKLLAKIASDMEKPDGLTILRRADLKHRVWALPASKLPGVGPKTEVRLAELGVATVGDLAAFPLPALQEHLGRAHGQSLHEEAWGIDESPIVTVWKPKSMSRQITFERDVTSRPRLAETLRGLARELAAEAKAERYLARTVAARVRFRDFETVSRQTTLPSPTDSAAVIERAVLDCFGRVDLIKPVRLVGARIGRLAPVRRPRSVRRARGKERGVPAPQRNDAAGHAKPLRPQAAPRHDDTARTQSDGRTGRTRPCRSSSC
jgi:DNA polymerase-4